MNDPGDGNHPDPVRRALDDTPCGVLRTDGDGRVLRVNATFCVWTGYAAGEIVGLRKFQDFLTMGGKIFHQTHWAPLLQIQGSVAEVKLDFVARDGQQFPAVVNARRHVQEGGVVHDIAAFVARDRDKYERELLLSQAKLQELVAQAHRLQEIAKDRALFAEQMMGMVGHDLRNPLSTIHLSSALLAAKDPTPFQRTVLERINRATERGHRLIADLLDFTQARLGRGLAVSLKPVNLHDVVAQAVDDLAHTFPNSEVRHAFTGEGECVADADRLAQLIGNLVANAVKYGRVGGPVKVTSDVEPQSFSIVVHNEGAAIPQESRAAIFEPLTRGASQARAGSSIGLGLFIVSEIAKAHGGAVSLDSTDDAGTFFRAVFPRVQSAGAR